MAQKLIINNNGNGNGNGNGRKQRDKRANFKNDDRIDSTLEQYGLAFVHLDITEDEIDWVASLENRGRLETPHNTALSDKYQVMMDNGEILPKPVVARQAENGLYRILGGFHTTHGAKKSKANIFSVYCVRVTGENKELVFEFLPKFLNMKNGEPLKESDQMASAVWAVKKKRNLEQAAADFGLRPSAVRDELRRLALATVLRDNDVDGLEYLTSRKTTFLALGQLEDNVPVLVAAAPVVIYGELKQDQTLAFVRQVKEQKSESDMLDVVQQWHKDYVQNKPSKPKGQTKSKYASSIGWAKSAYCHLQKVGCLTQLSGSEVLSPEALWRDAQYLGEVGDKMRQLYLKQRALAIQQGLIKPESELEFDSDDSLAEPARPPRN